jgi:hypothetical protein
MANPERVIKRSIRLLILALFWLVHFTMALLSVTLRDSPNRWANIDFGLAWTGLHILSCARLFDRSIDRWQAWK